MEQTTNKEIHSINSNFGKKGWAVVIFTMLVYMFTATVPDSMNVTVGAFSDIYGWDSNQMLSFAGIGGFLGIIISLVLGLVIQKTNVKWPTVAGMFVLAALWIFNGYVNTITAYAVVLIIIFAVSNSVNLVSTQQIMSNYFPRKKGIALGWATMGMCFSSAFMVPMIQGMLGASLATPFIAMCIIMVVLALVTAFWFKSYPEEMGMDPDNEKISEEEKAKNMEALLQYKSPFTIGKLLKTGQFWLISVIFGLLFLGLVVTMIQMVPRLMTVGLSPDQSILWLTIASIIGIPASYMWGAIDQKIGTKKAVIAFCVHWTIAMILAALGMAMGSAPISVVSVVVFAAALGGLGNLMPSMMIQVFGRYDFAAANKVVVPIVVGIRTCGLLIMSGILAAAGPNTALGYQNLFVLVTILSAVALVLSFLLSNKTIGKVD
jgi:sugar phosphate permease